MGDVVSLGRHPQRLREQEFVREFEVFLERIGRRPTALPKHAAKAVARCGFRGSAAGQDWTLTSPIDLVCSGLPARWTLHSSDLAVQLALDFNDFLAATRRHSVQDAAFLGGWIRAAQVPLLRHMIGAAEHRTSRPATSLEDCLRPK